MTLSDFGGRRGILYYGQFRRREPYAIADGIAIVPSGWHMLPFPSGGAPAVPLAFCDAGGLVGPGGSGEISRLGDLRRLCANEWSGVHPF